MNREKRTITYNARNKSQNSPTKTEFIISHMKQLAYFAILLVIGIIFLLVIRIILEPEQWRWYWKLSILYFIPPFGKETVIPAGLGLGSSLGVGVPLPPFLWSLSIWVFDILACLAILTNWWLLELIIYHIPAFPFVGIRRKKPRIYKKKVSLKLWYEGLHRKTQAFEAKKYGKLLPVALFIFMFVPFQGTGAMSTTIIGTWLGLRQRETLFVVAVGSFLSILLMMLVYLGIVEIWR